jgi:hypothetical protein
MGAGGRTWATGQQSILNHPAGTRTRRHGSATSADNQRTGRSYLIVVFASFSGGLNSLIALASKTGN